jgi:hypothetical protein
MVDRMKARIKNPVDPVNPVYFTDARPVDAHLLSTANSLSVELDSQPGGSDNSIMEIQGHVQNGVVILDSNVSLPEGADVCVVYVPEAPKPSAEKVRIELPLIRSKNPGSLHLTNDMIAEILNDQEISRGY